MPFLPQRVQDLLQRLMRPLQRRGVRHVKGDPAQRLRRLPRLFNADVVELDIAQPRPEPERVPLRLPMPNQRKVSHSSSSARHSYWGQVSPRKAN